jgi:hypothetical protein
MEEYNPIIYDYEDNYDNRYNLFNEYLQELADLELIFLYRNITLGYEEVFYKNKLISSVLNRDLCKIGKKLNNYCEYYDHNDHNIHNNHNIRNNKSIVWTWFRCNKNMLFNIKLLINKNNFL